MTTPAAAMAAFLGSTVNLPQGSLDELEVNVTALWTTLTTGDRLDDPPTDLQQQGSWAYGTIIKPLAGKEYDADVVLEFGDVGISPAEYLLRINEALKSTGTYRGKVELKNRCVRVHYAGKHHVDLVPLVGRTGGHHIVNRESGLFERAEPVGYADWFNERDQWSGGHLHKVVRLVKYLRDYKGTHSTKSVILTTLIAEQVDSGTEFTSTMRAFVYLMRRLADHLGSLPSRPTVPDPACPEASFNHRWTQEEFLTLKRVMASLADRAERAQAAATTEESTRLWRDIFGEGFPEVTSLGSDVAGSASTPGEQFPESTFTAVRPLYQASVDAVVVRRGVLRDRPLGSSVERGRSLRFTVRTNVPEPYEVHWKVLNRGQEALGDRRGTIFLGAREHEEQTKYRGRHFVEVYIVKDRVVLARARRNVTIR